MKSLLAHGARWARVCGLALAGATLGHFAGAQGTDTPAAAGTTPGALPQVTLPQLNELNLAVPRPVRAATAALGMGRQRLALVVGQSRLGSQLVLDSAPRDAQAVAAALRRAGFVVMLREDLTAADLRASLKEFRERLMPDGVGFIYATGLGAQIDGHNLLLPRETTLDGAAAPAAVVAQLRQTGVPLSELTDALLGMPDSPRLLVVDAAYQHPALARLPAPGLNEPRLPPGLMALFGHGLGSLKEVAAAAPLPIPEPTEPAEIAASPFATALVKALLAPRVNGPEALRSTRRALFDASQGQANPWLGGDTDSKEELAEASLLDSLIPRTPEELAREGARQLIRVGSRSGGEQSVADVLQQNPGSSPRPIDSARRAVPETPPTGTTSASTGALSSAVNVVGTAASVVGTVAAVGAAARAAEASAAVSVASSAVSAAGSVVSNVASTAARAAGAGSGAEAPARQVAQQAASAITPTPAPVAPAPVPATPPAVAPVPPAAVPMPPVEAVAAAAPAVAAATTTATAAQAGSDAAQRLARTAASAAADAATSSAPPERKPGGPVATDGRTTRNADGGERPVYAPRTNAFGYAEGDTFTYRVTDGWKDEVTHEFTTAIEEVLSDGKILANGQLVQMDAQGRLMKMANPDGTVSQFEPCQDLWWSKPERGQSRAVKFLEKQSSREGRARDQIEWKGSTSVGRLRRIETPAGEFEVLPMESSGWWYRTAANGTQSSGQWSRTVWYSPKLGHPVAIDIEDADRMGKLLKRERVELLHAQSARTATP
jgi:uncharacterized caspase-like protein